MPIIHIEWRRTLKWTFVLIVIGLGVPVGHLIHTRFNAHVHTRFNAQEVRVGVPIPYTVILKETVHGSDGIARVGKNVIQAIRSDGSVVRRLVYPNDADGSERLVQFASGTEVAINEFANTKSTIKKNVNPARWQRDPISKCINSLAGKPKSSSPEVISGEDTVAGYRTVKITINYDRKVTFWFALDYGCAQVKDRIDFGGKEFSEHNLVALIPGEPETALFHVPGHIREVPPSERIRGYDKVNRHCDAACAENLRKLDESYSKYRAVK